MLKKVIVIAAVLCSLLSIAGAEERISDESMLGLRQEEKRSGIYSPQSAAMFYDIACEILEPENVSIQEAREAICMLRAAKELDKSGSSMLRQILEAASVDTRTDYSKFVRSQLYRYISSTSNSELALRAVTYLLSQVNQREERENILSSLYQDLGSSNDQFASQISSYLGILASETADFESAAKHFLNAYNKNPYNVTAFEKLSEVSPDFVTVPLMAPYLRRKITLDPYSLERALDYADYAYQYSLFTIARDTYEYAAEIYEYQNPDEKIPERLFLPWIMSAYNVEYGESNALKIVNRIRRQGSFNLAVEYISIMSEPLSASQRKSRLDTLSETATQMLSTDHEDITPQSLAYFYIFMDPDRRKAEQMAKRAYAQNSESMDVRALYAYTLFESGDINTAEEMVSPMKDYNQIAAYTSALIQYEKDDVAAYLEELKELIAMEPGSFPAQMAFERLESENSEYIPEHDPYALKEMLESNFSDAVVPEFYKPDDIVSTKVSLKGVEFGYGSDLGLDVIISNNGKQPLVITDSSFFRGDIYMRVKISGDIEGIEPVTIRKRVTPVSPIKPDGGTLNIPIELSTEAPRLKSILEDFPQANLDLTFQAYFDPEKDDEGQLVSKIPMAVTTGRRLGVIMNDNLLEKKLENLRSGQAGQKLNTIELLYGLVAERNAADKYGVMYRHKAISQDILEEAFDITLNNEENWQVRLMMLNVLRKAGDRFEASDRFSEELQNPRWPVRLLSLYGLTRLSESYDAESEEVDEFQKVLNWVYQADEQPLVRHLAEIEGAKEVSD